MIIRSKIHFLVLFLSLFLLGCNKNKIQKVEEERFLFGTSIKIVLYSENLETSKKIIDETYGLMNQIEKKYSSRNEESIVYKINKNPLVEQKIDMEFYGIIKNTIEISKLTKGSFDITVEPLMSLWGFDDLEIDKIPNDTEIKKALELVNFEDINLNKTFISLKKNNQKIDTGSFLKGYAIHKASEFLKEKGVTSGMITAISSIEVIGSKPENKPFKIGVQNPKSPEKLLYTIELTDNALGVAGDYQTFVEINGKKYHHIMDSKTGKPSEYNSLVLVLGKNSYLCDLYDTGFFLMKPEEILSFVEKQKDMEVFIVDKNGKEYFSLGIKKYLKKN